MRPGCRSIAILCLAVAGLVSPARADDSAGMAREFQLLGPLPVRDLTPLDVLRLDMLPSNAVWETGSGWGFEFQHQHANTFLTSFNVRSFLAARGRRAALTEEDLDAIYSLEGDVVYIDGAVGVVNLTTHYYFNDRWSMYVTVPAQYYDGGPFDSSIENFHENLGLGQAGRDLVSPGQFQIVLNVQGERFAALRPSRDSGVGDPFVGVRRRFRMGEGWESVLEGAIKFPLADVDDLFSSGRYDVGFQYSLQRKFRRNGLYLVLNHVWAGENQFLGRQTDHTIPKATFTWEFGATRRTSLLIQASASDSMVLETDVTDLKKTKYLTTLGFRHTRGRLIFDMGFIENIENQGNSFDIGLYWGIGFLSGLSS